MNPCSTDDTPPRATCKKTFYICINNLIFVIVSSKKKEACKTINATGLTISSISKLEEKKCVLRNRRTLIFFFI